VWGAVWNFDLGWQRIVDDRRSRGFLSDVRRIESNQSDLIGLTISAAGAIDDGSWIVGSEIYYDTVESSRVEENIVSGRLSTTTARFPNDSTMDHAAVFANLQKDLGFRHSLTGGLRFSTIKTKLAQTPSSVAASTRQNDVSADFGWVVDLREQFQFTANLSYGFRAPNIFDLGTLGERPGNRFNIPNPELQSERITQLDAGIRYHSDPLEFDLVMFALHYTDRISSIFTGGVTTDGRDITQSQNVAEADIHGVELSGKWLITGTTEANFVLNYIRGEQAEQTGAGVPADRVPPLNGQLKLSYFLSDALSVKPYINFASGQDRLSPRDVRDTRIDPNGTPGWVSVNVQSTWHYSDAIRVTLKLENLLDVDYRAHGSGINAVGRNLYLSFHTIW
jgi:outer membrane receptor protein involved in Fe transport